MSEQQQSQNMQSVIAVAVAVAVVSVLGTGNGGVFTAALLGGISAGCAGGAVALLAQKEKPLAVRLVSALAVVAVGVVAVVMVRSASAPKWAATTPGSTGITLDAPYELKLNNPELPPQLKTQLAKLECWQGEQRTSTILAARWQYVDTVNPDATGAANGSASAMKAAGGVTDFTWKVEPSTVSGHKAVLMTADFKKDGKPARFLAVYAVEGHVMWQVGAGAPQSEEALVRRVIDSVKIDFK